MAAISMYVHSRDTVEPEGLCPRCMLPSLKLYKLTRIDWDGLTEIGERIACKDENKWVSDLKEYKNV